MQDNSGSPGKRGGVARWAPHVAALVPAAMLLGLMTRRVWDVDIFWQLRLGEMILDQMAPVRTEPFAALHIGEPLPSVAWLGQALMAAVRQLGGWGALRVFDALCWLGGFWAAGAACRGRGATPMAVAMAMVLAMFAALPTASIRPQTFAVLCFGALLALQRLGLRPVTMICLGAPLLVLWQNLHPSVSMAAIALGLHALPGWVNWLRRRSGAPPWAQTALAGFAVAAMFLTPDGFSILQVAATNAEISIAIGASEWLPLWTPGNWTNAVPVLAVALLALRAVARRGWQVDAGEVLAALGFFLMMLTAYRFTLFWAVTMVPVMARALTPVGKAQGPSSAPRRGLTVAAVVIAALLSPLLLPTRFVETIPLAALERLRREGVRGTVYGDFPFGGAIADTGWPDWKVAYDGRYYRYSRKEWQYNGGIEHGIVPLVDVLRKWHPAAFVLNSRHNAKLADALARRRDWRRIYDHRGVVVYVPR